MEAVPKVVKWAVWFCIAMAFLNIALGFVALWAAGNVGMLMERLAADVPKDMPEYIAASDILRKSIMSMVVTSFVFAPLNIWLAFAKPCPATFFFHAGNFLAGAASCLFAPVAVPLLVAWMKPSTQAYFGVSKRSSDLTPPADRR